MISQIGSSPSASIDSSSPISTMTWRPGRGSILAARICSNLSRRVAKASMQVLRVHNLGRRGQAGTRNELTLCAFDAVSMSAILRAMVDAIRASCQRISADTGAFLEVSELPAAI